MASKRVFSSASTKTTVNDAGGKAYDLKDEEALVQLAVTGHLGDTYYATAELQLERLLEAASKCSDEFVAKTAVYARTEGRVKDAPAVLLAYLSTRPDPGSVLWSGSDRTAPRTHFDRAFPRIVDSGRMLRTFVQIMRSGKVGRKSLGTSPRRAIRKWFSERTADEVFRQSVGNAPSIGDIVKLTHPKPSTAAHGSLYRYLLKGHDENHAKEYPLALAQLLAFRSGASKEVPRVPFQLLMSLPLTHEQWVQIALTTSWTTLRMNLNTFERHGVFKDSGITQVIASRLANPEEVRKSGVYPYQLFSAYKATTSVPQVIANALQDALEVATENVPPIDGGVAVCVDSSGSMTGPITGYRSSASSSVTCNDVASLMAASILRTSKDVTIVRFDTSAEVLRLNSRDSVVTNAARINRSGGGTDCGSAIKLLNATECKAKTIVMISDSESWAGAHRGTGAGMETAFRAYQRRVPGAKLVCIDITPHTTSQVKSSADVLLVGGFGDSVFDVVRDFAHGTTKSFVDAVRAVVL